MRNMYYLHSLNEDIAFGVGVVLNGLLVGLIFTTNMRKLSKYNSLLLQPVLVNLFLLFTNYLTKPMKIIDHGYEYYIMNGIAHHLPQPWRFIAFDVWLLAIGLSITTIPIGFLYQYYMIVHNIRITVKKQLLYFTLSSIIALGYSNLCYFIFYYDSYMYLDIGNFLKDVIGDENGVVWTVGLSLPYYQNKMVLVNIAIICIVVGTSYSIVVYCNSRTYLHIKRHKKTSTDGVQRQLSRIIIYTAIVPFVSTALPCVVIIWALLHPDISIIAYTVFITFAFAWVAPCNAFFFLFLIKPYRQRVVNFFLFLMCRKPKHNRIMSSINTNLSNVTNTVY